ncbi:hypothetical protein [Haladaptatus caseinilyticus]|uniref:hypothetical protein n=1 Tax=Haladaptatus caseinilyticus TaxID=2993314 RepID=UPI00224A57F1|nr:hypothetical protein [Haladaptatus caseinilyticus]
MHVVNNARRAAAVVVVCLLVAGSGVVTDVKGGHATPETNAPTDTIEHSSAPDRTAGEDLRVEFDNCSAVSVYGSAERVAVGTTWFASDGVATSYFEYGPVNGTTDVTPPNQGKAGTLVTYVRVYDDHQATPVLSRRHPNATACHRRIDSGNSSDR